MPRRVTAFAFYSCVALSQACASPAPAAPAKPAGVAVMIEFAGAVGGAEPALLAALSARAGAGVSVRYRAAVSSRRHAYILDCPASDTGCRDAVARLSADPRIRNVSADEMKTGIQTTR